MERDKWCLCTVCTARMLISDGGYRRIGILKVTVPNSRGADPSDKNGDFSLSCIKTQIRASFSLGWQPESILPQPRYSNSTQVIGDHRGPTTSDQGLPAVGRTPPRPFPKSGARVTVWCASALAPRPLPD